MRKIRDARKGCSTGGGHLTFEGVGVGRGLEYLVSARIINEADFSSGRKAVHAIELVEHEFSPCFRCYITAFFTIFQPSPPPTFSTCQLFKNCIPSSKEMRCSQGSPILFIAIPVRPKSPISLASSYSTA